MTFPVCFAVNPTGWDRETGTMIPGGMTDCLVQPILPHLAAELLIERQPQYGAVNVYYAHRKRYEPRREPGIKSVFVSHGIADKQWRNASAVSSFHFVFVSGPAWSDRLVAGGMNPNRIIEAGYTKLDPILQGKIPAPERDSRIRVVYAPTHGGGGEARAFTPPKTLGAKASSWWLRDAVTSLLPESTFDVVLAPHPRHREDKRSTLSEYVGADVVIADGGSTIYEAWALGLPVVFPTWLTGAANENRKGGGTFESHIYRNQLGYHATEPELLAPLVELAAELGIGEPETEFCERIFPADYRGRSGRLHAEALDDIARLDTPRHRPRVRYVVFERVALDGRRHERKVVAGSPDSLRYSRRPGWTVKP